MEKMCDFFKDENGRTEVKIKYIARFMDFTNFVDLVENKKLTLVKPELWEDPYENYIFKYFNDREGLKKIVEVLKSIGVSNIGIKMFLLCSNKNTAYGQSWTYISESDALWRIYNTNKNNTSVRVKVSFDNIIKLKDQNPSFSIAPIKYIDKPNLEEDIRELFSEDSKNIDIYKAMLLKRTSFNHENEVRLFIGDYLNQDRYKLDEINNVLNKLGSGSVQSDSEVFYDLLIKVNEFYKNAPKVRDIRIEDPSKFIDSVLLNPLAPEWFNNTLEAYCRKNSINYLGKSTLYDFE